MKNRFSVVAVLGIVVATMSGCGLGHRMYKTQISDLNDWDSDCYRSSNYLHPDYSAKPQFAKLSLMSNSCLARDEQFSVGVIEFNDEGLHWDRRQLHLLRTEIERITERQIKGKLSTRGILLVVFVHGWRHNASEGSNNLLQFRKVISDLGEKGSQCRKLSTGDDCMSERHVLGVYLGWRGDATGLTSPSTRASRIGNILKSLQIPTFWHRKGGARRVAGTPMTETLLSLLESIESQDLKRFRARLPRENGGPAKPSSNDLFKPSRSLIIGHSFGARVVEHAVAQAFVAKRLESRRILRDGRFGLGRFRTEFLTINSQIATAKAQHMHQMEIASAEDKLVSAKKRKMREIEGETSHLTRIIDQATPELNDGMELLSNLNRSSIELYGSCDSLTEDVECNQPQSAKFLTGFCVRRAVECEYDKYICSARKVLGEPHSCEELESARSIKLDAEKKADWQSFRDDLIDERIAVVEANGTTVIDTGNLPRQCKKVMEHSDFAHNSVLGRVLEFVSLNSRSVAVNFFLPVSFGEDSTEVAEGELLEFLRTSQQTIDRREKALADVCAAWIRSAEHSSHVRRKAALEAEKETIGFEVFAHRSRSEEARILADAAEQLEKGAEAKRKMHVEFVKFELERLLRPPADLVVLLNPATEALSALNLINAMCTFDESDAMAEYRVETDVKRPWIISITSEGDSDTKRFFPAGVLIGRMLRLDPSYRNSSNFRRTPEAIRLSECDYFFGDYKQLLTKTAGHLNSIHSHVLEEISKEEKIDRDQLGLLRVGDSLYSLRKNDAGNNDSHYWVLSAPEELMEDHNDVFNEKVVQTLTELIKIGNVFVPQCPPLSDLCDAPLERAEAQSGFSEEGN